MKKIGKILTVGALTVFLFFPALGFVSAQGGFVGPTQAEAQGSASDYTLLARLPGISENPNCTPLVVNPDGSTSGGCQTNLSTYLPGAFKLIISLCAVLAFLVLTYGGVLYMTSDAVWDKSQGKTYITNALIGLGLAIASYVILYTINPGILSFQLNMNQPSTTAQSAADVAAIQAASATASGLTASGADLLSGSTLAADQSNRATLASADIGVNNPPCGTQTSSGVLTSNCTDVNLIKQPVMDDLSQVMAGTCQNNTSSACANSCATASASTCAVTITGGNEASLHNTDTTHSTGDTVDLAPTSALNNYLSKTNPQAANPVNGTTVTVNGLNFTYETAGANAANTGAHWHATTCTSPSVSSCP